jgi:peptidyl-Lys metalloendopeptidase
MFGAARLNDSSACIACGATAPDATASGNVRTNARGAVRMGDHGTYPQCCAKKAPVRWTATTGAATVLVNGDPAVALTHTTTQFGGRGAMVAGSANVFVGGASTSMEEMARADALKMIDKGIASLDRWNEEDRRHFKEWFGTDSEWARQFMRRRMQLMRDQLLSEDFAVGSKEDNYAHVYKVGKTVYLDERFWTAPRMGEDSRAGTLLHETSHFYGAGGTDDVVYGRRGCRALARKDPSGAMRNADSHEYWLETLP